MACFLLAAGWAALSGGAYYTLHRGNQLEATPGVNAAVLAVCVYIVAQVSGARMARCRAVHTRLRGGGPRDGCVRVLRVEARRQCASPSVCNPLPLPHARRAPPAVCAVLPGRRAAVLPGRRVHLLGTGPRQPIRIQTRGLRRVPGVPCCAVLRWFGGLCWACCAARGTCTVCATVTPALLNV